MNRLDIYLYKSAAATLGQEAEKAPGIGDAVKGFGKNVALTAATMFAPALAGKGWNAIKGMAATKITEIGNQLPELGKQLSNNPGVGNFMNDVRTAFKNVTGDNAAHSVAESVKNGTGITGTSKSQRVAAGRAAVFDKRPRKNPVAGTTQNATNAAVRQTQPAFSKPNPTMSWGNAGVNSWTYKSKRGSAQALLTRMYER